MKLGIMQPYFFPYIGYFQLINAVDLFVVYDDLQYISRGWINRNRILVNGKSSYITLPIRSASHLTSIKDSCFNGNFAKEKNSILRRIEGAYRKAPHFSETFELIEKCFQCPDPKVSAFVSQTIKQCCQHLGISTPLNITPSLQINADLRGQDRAIAITKHLGSDHYLNPVGGMEIYSGKEFQRHGIELSFVRTNEFSYKQFGGEFVPNLSIIDVLMFNDRDTIRDYLSRYTLISNSDEGAKFSTTSSNNDLLPGSLKENLINQRIDSKWRVLVFPGATEIAMELRQSLAGCKDVLLFSAGSQVSNHAPFVFERHFIIPEIGKPNWLDELAAVVDANQITHIFPAHDDVLLALAENADTLKAKVVTSPLETCRIARFKIATQERLAGIVPTPERFHTPEAVKTWPVFLKPDRGEGAKRTALAKNASHLAALLAKDADRIILEYLPGSEFTVDCFSDRDRGLQYVCGRQRRRIRSGIAMDAVVVEDQRFWEYAEAISKVLKFHGAWFFQVKADQNGVLKVMEVAPRIGGTSALSRVRGVNLPLLSLYEAERLPVQIIPVDYSVEIDRALVNRYRHNLRYRTIYVDFDDTLVIRGKLNVELIKLLYQGVNRGTRLVLLTRHKGDLKLQLRQWRLESLFDEVIHLGQTDSKADFIKETDAIFIDDSFAERKAVHEKTGIVTIDPSMVELLLDDRI